MKAGIHRTPQQGYLMEERHTEQRIQHGKGSETEHWHGNRGRRSLRMPG